MIRKREMIQWIIASSTTVLAVASILQLKEVEQVNKELQQEIINQSNILTEKTIEYMELYETYRIERVK